MGNALVSVIVPVYNSEKYLPECIESILNQTYKNIEVLLIDDCSIDNSFEMCSDFAKKDSRVHLFKKEKNEGVSEARNFGLHKAKGEYLCFVDGDDYLENNYVECLLAKAQEGNLDLTFCRYNSVAGDAVTSFYELSLEAFVKHKKFEYCFDTTFDKIEKPTIQTDRQMEVSKITFGMCWRVLYKKSFIKDNGLIFNKELSYCEDLIFLVSCLSKTDKVGVIDDFLYNYRQSSNSITRNFNFKLVEQTEKASSVFLDLTRGKLTDAQVKYFYYFRGLSLLYKVLSFGTKKDLKQLLHNNFIKTCFKKENYKVYKSTLLGFKRKLPIVLLQHKMFGLYKLLRKAIKRA